VGQFPHLIRNDRPALADSLYRELSAVVASRSFLAHIRQATYGDINVLNCHPFQHGAWTFAHNGQIAGYAEVEGLRDRIVALVDERFRRHILGETDSEVLFHIFLSHLGRLVESIHDPGVTGRHALLALQRTVTSVLAIADADDPDPPTKLTFVLTNGNVMVGYRHKVQLHFSTYKTHCPDRDTCHAYQPERCEAPAKDGIVKHLIVASEVIGGENVWEELEDGEYVCLDHGMNVSRGELARATTP
jgi:glutamine amidotransferase